MHTYKRNSESANFMQTLWGGLLVVMVLVGLCGTLYKLLAPKGWMAAMMGQGFSGGVALIGLLFVLGVIGWIARTWTTTREQAASANLVVYAFAATGVFYAFQLWTKGAF